MASGSLKIARGRGSSTVTSASFAAPRACRKVQLRSRPVGEERRTSASSAASSDGWRGIRRCAM